jgi:hypothetical protein
MAPILFLILTPVWLFAAANDLLLPKIHSWFRCSVVIVGIAYRTHLKALSVSGTSMGLTTAPGTTFFPPAGYGMEQVKTRGLEA